MLDRTAGETDVRMEINFEIQPGSPAIGNSLNSVEIDVQSGSPDVFSGTNQSDVVEMGVDTDGDGVIENDIQSDINGWTISDGGSTLKIELGGSAYTNPRPARRSSSSSTTSTTRRRPERTTSGSRPAGTATGSTDRSASPEQNG